MHRAMAIVERELRRFRRTPLLIAVSMIFPIVQLVVLGYAFGGSLRNLKLGVVDQDHGLPGVKIRELAGAISANARTFQTIEYADAGQAMADLRDGHINGILTIPPDFSRRTLTEQRPHIALIADNADNFVAATLAGSLSGIVGAYNHASASPARIPSQLTLDVVEIYPYVPYIQYLLPGSIVMSIFMMVIIGGGIIYIDDKARGLHEGYLVTPITKFELIMGFNISGAIKAILSGTVLMTIGSLIAGVENPFEPLRMAKVFLVIVAASLALVSMMFLIMVRVSNPLLPRAIFGVLNTLLFFPSGAVYPTQAFPGWMRAIAAIDPFTYAVHAFKNLLLKNTGLAAITGDLTYLIVFSIVTMTAATLLFRRTL